MKFDFSKSTEADFQNKIQSDLDILMSNILYMTHEIDYIKKIVNTINNTTKLQKQVDEYFTDEEAKSFEDSEHIPEEKTG